MNFSILGQQTRTPSKKLETFDAPPDVKRVVMVSEEFTSLCPVTGQPDFQTVRIEFEPQALCLESKSLKLYLWSFREEGVFCEALSQQIARDVAAAVHPRFCKVTVLQRARGGISIEAPAEVHS